jgi:hypothetical protein
MTYKKLLQYGVWEFMKLDEVVADVELRFGGKSVKLKAVVDTGASRSVMSRHLSEELGAFTPLEKPYDLRTVDEGGRLRIVGYCRVGVVFQGVEVPGGAVFEVAENLREGVDLIVGRPEIDSWGIVFTPEGPKPRRVPIEFEIL